MKALVSENLPRLLPRGVFFSFGSFGRCGLGGAQGEGVFDIDAGQLIGELLEAPGIFDVLAQLVGFPGRNAAAGVAPVLPNLVFEVRADARCLRRGDRDVPSTLRQVCQAAW